MRYLIGIIFVFFHVAALAKNNVLNVYNWSDYLPRSVIEKFENEYHVIINYSEYSNNEALYAKLKATKNPGYDVIFPSNEYVDRMRKQHMLARLDKKQLSNIKHLNPTLLNKPFDPNNHYSLPYLVGATGIAINTNFINPKTIHHWNDFWQKRFRNKLVILNDMREVFSMALISLHYSVNDTNPGHIKAAYLKLKTLLPNVKLFNSTAIKNIYVDEDATAGMSWSGDINLVHEENKAVIFIYPKDKYVLAMDCMAIPKNAPHPKIAHLFINFLMRPEIAKEIAVTEGYTSPNLQAIALMPKHMRHNPLINPNALLLKRGVYQMDVGNATRLYQKYWQRLKIEG